MPAPESELLHHSLMTVAVHNLMKVNFFIKRKRKVQEGEEKVPARNEFARTERSCVPLRNHLRNDFISLRVSSFTNFICTQFESFNIANIFIVVLDRISKDF